MKIGLITHHWVPNFGANLQALASYLYLKSLGHEVIVIDYKPRELVELVKQGYPRYSLKHTVNLLKDNLN